MIRNRCGGDNKCVVGPGTVDRADGASIRCTTDAFGSASESDAARPGLATRARSISGSARPFRATHTQLRYPKSIRTAPRREERTDGGGGMRTDENRGGGKSIS